MPQMGICWVCEEIAGSEDMHLVRRTQLYDDGVCLRHRHAKGNPRVIADVDDFIKAVREKANDRNDQ
jgi:hypothetical protein